jgi:predicted transcriptional regulator
MNLLKSKPQKERAKALLNWLELYFPGNTVRPVSRKELHSRFGNTSRSPGKQLKELFLTTVDPHYNMMTGKCITYRRNTDGVRWVKEQLGLVNFKLQLPEEQQEQLASGDFEYEEKSDRLWNDFQFIPRVTRDPLLKEKGYHWDYDIEAAAPTLLYQYSQKIYQNKWLDLPSEIKSQKPHQWQALAIEHYIHNRSEARETIAKDCEISVNEVKTVINALFQGGVLSCYQENKTFKELEYDARKIRALQSNQYIISLRKDIKAMWDIIKETLPVRYRENKNGVSVRVALSGRDKSAVYRSLEMEVGVVIRKYLKRTKNTNVWFHDGWCSKKRVYSTELVSEVLRKTGYLIKLDEGVIEN